MKKFFLKPQHSFVLILFIGLITLLLGAIQLSITLRGGKSAFLPKKSAIVQSIKENLPAVSKYKKDTDFDGIPDFLERNYYKTSPYLADSDNDGIKDGEEVKKGQNPLCDQKGACSGDFGIPQQTTTQGKEKIPTQEEISSFFQNQDELNKIIEKLEKGEISEEEAIKMFENLSKQTTSSSSSSASKLNLPEISDNDIIILETSTKSALEEYFGRVRVLFEKYPIFEKINKVENIENLKMDEITSLLNKIYQEGKEILVPRACLEIHKKGLSLVRFSKENLEKMKTVSNKEEAEKISQDLSQVSSETASLLKQAREIAGEYNIVLE